MQPRSTTQPAVDVRALRKIYPGGVEAVKGIDFEVAAGEVFGLLGPNGAGKSTTIGMLTTTIAPTSGRARVAGYDVDERAARRAQRQQRRLPGAGRRPRAHRPAQPRHPRPPLARRARRGRAPHRRARRDARARRARSTGRSAATAAASGGGSRSPARSSREPQVLFLDEPTVGLDPRIRHELLDVIGRPARPRRDRRSCSRPTTSTRPSGSATGSRSSTPGRIVALDTPGALLAGLGHEIVELRVNGDAGDRARRRCARAASPATTRSPSAPRSPFRCTTAARRTRSPPSTTPVSPSSSDQHAPTDARRRLPAADRRTPRRRRLKRKRTR